MTGMPPTMDENATLVPSGTISVPTRLEYHAVEDGELERLMKIHRPFYGAIALTALGVFLGALPEAINVLGKVVQQPATAGDVLYLTVAPVMLAIAICTGVIAFVGKSERVKALEAIRARPKIPLPAGHPSAPPRQTSST